MGARLSAGLGRSAASLAGRRRATALYFDEPQHEGRPHFHATYGDDEASFDIEDAELIAGGLPRRAQKMVAEWAKDHQEELRENWELAREHKPPQPIDPLR